jgi:hypothetical protein
MSDRSLQPREPGQWEPQARAPMTIDTSPEMSGDDDEIPFDPDGAETVMYDTGEGDVEIVVVPRRR